MPNFIESAPMPDVFESKYTFLYTTAEQEKDCIKFKQFGGTIDRDGDSIVDGFQSYIEKDGQYQLYSDFYDFDNNGIYELQIQYNTDGNKIFEKQINNKTGLTSKETFYKPDGDILCINFYTYDQYGNKSRQTCIDSNNDILHTTDFQFDKEGSYLGHATTFADGARGGVKPIFDENMNKIRDIYFYPDNNGGSYYYDENYNKIIGEP